VAPGSAGISIKRNLLGETDWREFRAIVVASAAAGGEMSVVKEYEAMTLARNNEALDWLRAGKLAIPIVDFSWYGCQSVSQYRALCTTTDDCRIFPGEALFIDLKKVLAKVIFTVNC